MVDIEKVIKGLEICKNHDGSNCPECPYFVDECVDDMCADALELLKEQQQIVRCKDCKWWDKEPDAVYGYCHACKHGYHSSNWEIGIYRKYKADWFCADGECK